MRRKIKDMLVVGFALFSMFFGAGNVIFPPYLGLGCGAQWFQGFAYYFVADIGLALVTLYAVQRCGGYENLTRPLGEIPSTVLMSAIILCIGPMLAIPRTAASTYEMSILPLFPETNPYLFAAGFFLIIALLSVKESSVVDIIGKVLTPLLLLGLATLIIKGMADPIGPVPAGVPVENVPMTGIEAGYQTMDVLAALVFGIIIAKNIRAKGYLEKKEQNRMTAGSGLIAGVGLLAVYCGLCFLGVSASEQFTLDTDRTVLLTSIVKLLLGSTGKIIFGIVVALACLTTAIALVSSAAHYFSELSDGKMDYKVLVLLICGFSMVVSTVGLNQIIAIAAPILDIIYPPALLVILLSFGNRIIRNPWVYRMGALGALACSTLIVCSKYLGIFRWVEHLPLYYYGFGWLVPALICAVVGFAVKTGARHTAGAES